MIDKSKLYKPVTTRMHMNTYSNIKVLAKRQNMSISKFIEQVFEQFFMNWDRDMDFRQESLDEFLRQTFKLDEKQTPKKSKMEE